MYGCGMSRDLTVQTKDRRPHERFVAALQTPLAVRAEGGVFVAN